MARTPQDIQTEYAQVCTQLGNIASQQFFLQKALKDTQDKIQDVQKRLFALDDEMKAALTKPEEPASANTTPVS